MSKHKTAAWRMYSLFLVGCVAASALGEALPGISRTMVNLPMVGVKSASRLHELLAMPVRAVGALTGAPARFFLHRRVSPMFEKRKAGRFVITPTLSLTGRYSDNIFGLNENETEDYVATIAPGLKAEIPFGDGNSLFAQYELHVIRPRHYHAELATEDHYLAVEAELKIKDGLTLTLTDDASRQTVPADDHEDRPDQFYYNDANATLTWELNDKWTAETALGHEITRFRRHESRIDDFHAPRAQATVFYGLTENVSVLVDYAYKHMYNDNDTKLNDEPEDTDNDNHTVCLGLEFNKDLPVHGRIQAGVGRKNFGDTREEDVHTWVFESDLTWDATDKLAINLSGSRSIEETQMSAGNDGSGRTFITTTVELGAEYSLTDQWTLSAGTSLTRDRYKQRGEFPHHRVDWLPGIACGLAYQPAEWVTTELGYEYFDNHSNADGETWRESAFTFTVAVGF